VWCRAKSINTEGVGGWWAPECWSCNLNSFLGFRDESPYNPWSFVTWRYGGEINRAFFTEMKIRPGSNTLHIHNEYVKEYDAAVVTLAAMSSMQNLFVPWKLSNNVVGYDVVMRPPATDRFWCFTWRHFAPIMVKFGRSAPPCQISL